MQLSRKRVIAAAIGLIEAEGVEAVSMQRLATELGCNLISLYSHVPSGTALLDGIADEVMSGITWTCVPGASSQDQVRTLLREVSQIATAHPRCAMLALSRRDIPASLMRPAETALAGLQAAGFSGPGAARIVRTFATYLLGLLAREVEIAPALTDGDSGGSTRRPRPAEFPQLTELYKELQASDVAGDVEFGAEMLARSLTARSAESGQPGSR
jgi:AcrR family transcriptional regulator